MIVSLNVMHLLVKDVVNLQGSWLSTILCPAIAQSILPVAVSIRRSTYQSFTDITIVSVDSSAGVVSHRNEIRLEKRQVDCSGLILAIFLLEDFRWKWLTILGGSRELP